MRSSRLLPVVIAVLVAASIAAGQESYVRYRIEAPETSTIATVLMQPHRSGGPVPLNWTGLPLPGLIAKSGLYVPPGVWSDWYALPAAPMWGTIDLAFRGAEPIETVRARLQVAAPLPEERFVLAELEASSETGSKVGFMLPPSPLSSPAQIESVQAGLARRRRVAESVAVPERDRPKKLAFSPSGILADPTIKDSQRKELDTCRLLGFNTIATEIPLPAEDFSYREVSLPGRDVEADRRALAAYRERFAGEPPPIVKAMLFDEPGYYSGFGPIWQETGVRGFRDFLAERGVDPKLFDAGSFEEVDYIASGQAVAADAPVARRRLWYWSSRYRHYACALYFKRLSETSHETFPDAKTTVNFSDHTIIIGDGGMVAGRGPDFFMFGRIGALDMYFSEDWIFSELSSWGNGLWQRVSYIAELLRAAGRYHHRPHPVLGMHVIPNGYDPLGSGTDRTVGARVNLLLGRGVKHFSFFTYGPTARGTHDFWGDNAPGMRGTADAIGLVGKPEIEPFVYEGQPAPPQACLLFGTTAEYWQAANGTEASNQEKQYTYLMVQQEQIPLDIIDTFDLDRFIKDYRAALFVDWNIRRASAGALRKWVEAGGVLLLWPNAASRDEYNDPLEIFAGTTDAGTHAVGQGRVVRLAEPHGLRWWERTRKASVDAGSPWPIAFDAEHRSAVIGVLKRAGVTPPVTVSADAVVANALVSERGVAVPLVNLRGLHARNAITYDDVRVTLTNGTGIRRAYTSRHGTLRIQRDGQKVTVVMPLEATDIVVFAR
ncbi:MAG: hypothetical protein CMJ85_06265 [Planctomycetes bacterium]|nr:hypothetical protein [Planctomycetota bacterium]